MKGKIPYIIAVLFLIGFIVLSVFMVQKNEDRELVKIYTKNSSKDGSDFINDSIVQLIISKNMKLDSAKVKDVQVDKIETWLAENPFVKNVDVYKTPKGELITEIVQKRPVVRVKSKTSEYYLTDEYDKIPLSSVYSINATLVKGEIDSTEYKPLVDLITFINGDNLLKKNITGIVKDTKKSFTLKVNTGSFNVELGGLDDFKGKLEKLKLFYEQYIAKIGFDKYKKVDLQFKNQIVAEKK